jgi:hypothetical protein
MKCLAGYHTALVGTRVISCRRLECNEFQYGRAAMCSWCFCQLETIDKDVIYKQVDGIYWEQSLICLVELKGTHRYKNCPVLQRIMPKMRNEGLSEDRKTLNSKVIDGNNVNMPRPENTRFVRSITNDAASISMFRSYLEKHHTECTPDNISKSAIVIRCLSHLNMESILREVFGSSGYEQSKQTS